MESRVKAILDKISKKRTKGVNLSLISDYETLFDEALELDRSMTSSLDLLNEKAEGIQNEVYAFEMLYNSILDLEMDIEVKYSRLADVMQEVEKRAEELGAAPFEFMPNYQEAVDILDTQFVGKYQEYDSDTNSLISRLDL
jgi:predicted  nucleic acid-binding Zn-ribbon protein